nr:hypothetical protein [Tolivirales sp.]
MNPESEQIIVLSKWAIKWMKFAYDRVVNGSDVHQYAKKMLVELDSCESMPEDFVETHVVTLTKTVECGGEVTCPVNNVKRTKRLTKGKRSKFAMALAKEAYLKFGKRPVSEANEIVTRKWMTKYLESEKFVDLRTVDKILAIDRAIFLSFVPTIVYNNMKVAAHDEKIAGRISGSITSFGKVFSLGSSQSQ